MSDVQQRVYQAILQGPRGKFGGPFIPLLHAPDILDRVQALGEALRFHGELEGDLREIAILAVARNWRCAVEWHAHVLIALNEGVPPGTIKAIAVGDFGRFAGSRQGAVLAICNQLHEAQFLSDQVYGQASDALGEEQIVELVSLVGYYTMLAIVLNAFEILPDTADEALPPELRLPG